MEMSLVTAQTSGQNAGSVVQEAVEKALVELVRVRQMEVERLEVELAELRAHCAILFQSFSVPTFPSGIYSIRAHYSISFLMFIVQKKTSEMLSVHVCTLQCILYNVHANVHLPTL